MCAEPELYMTIDSHTCACGRAIGYGAIKCWKCHQRDDKILAFDIVIDELNDEIARKIKEKEENE